MTRQSEFVKKARIQSNLTRAKLAKGLGFTPQFYGKVEHGLVDLPPARFKRFLKLTNANVEEFFSETLGDYGDYINKYLPKIKNEKIE
jgi:transcriptional regulator with XRE-family HTH domain